MLKQHFFKEYATYMSIFMIIHKITINLYAFGVQDISSVSNSHQSPKFSDIKVMIQSS